MYSLCFFDKKEKGRMDMLVSTLTILNNFFDNEEKQIINEIIQELKKKDCCSDKLWEFDQTIGGIGGYCQPINPTVCCFQGTEVRNVYRSYQYARNKVDIGDVNIFARDMIRDCGLSLEYLLKLVLYRKSVFDRIKIDFGIDIPLGALINRIEKKRWLETNDIEELKMMLGNYNVSKHSINIEERERTFLAEDAIIYYLASRKIGIKLLRNLDTDLTKGLANMTFDIIYKREDYMEVDQITIDGKVFGRRKDISKDEKQKSLN